jgi:hemoglobin/transferrin/lactoferrin receptor protein
VKLTGEYVNRYAQVDQRHDLGRQPPPSTTTNLHYLRDQEQIRYRTTLMHRYTPNLGWLDQAKWQISMSPFERNFTGNRSRLVNTSQLEYLDFLLNYQEKFYEGDVQLNSSFLAMMSEHKLTYGGYYNITETDYVRRDITTNRATGVVTTTNAGGFNFADATTTRGDLFFQDDIRPTELFNGRVTISPGVRYATYVLDPRPNQFYVFVPGKEPKEVKSEELVKQLNIKFAVSEEHTLFARYAEGFKMPTAQQLYTSLPSATGQSLIPNPDLKPESVQSYELSLRRKFSNGFYSVTVFKSDYTDFIQNFTPNGTFTNGFEDLTYKNISKVNLVGYEVSGEYHFTDKWSTTLAASYVTGHQQATPGAVTTAFNGSTPLTLVNSLRYLDVGTGVDAQLYSTWTDNVGSRAAVNDFRNPTSLIFDALFTYRPPTVKGLALHASVLNLADTRYFRSLNGATSYTTTPSTAVAIANPLELQTGPGRTFKVGMNYQF